MKNILAELRTSLAAVVFLAVILGGLYPLTVWVLAQGLFPAKANGSLIVREGRVVGSSLIGQNFAGAGYFHPRPSAAGQGYDALGSGGSNLGPLSKKLSDAVRGRIDAYRAENGLAAGAAVPPDAVTASASGLDPHLSLANALLQIPRVARARGISQTAVKRQVEKFTAGRDLGILGEPRVNVLLLNIALDDLQKSDPARVTSSGNK
jgi:K+-transporting ATPase ATPase C chain